MELKCGILRDVRRHILFLSGRGMNTPSLLTLIVSEHLSVPPVEGRLYFLARYQSPPFWLLKHLHCQASSTNTALTTISPAPGTPCLQPPLSIHSKSCLVLAPSRSSLYIHRKIILQKTLFSSQKSFFFETPDAWNIRETVFPLFSNFYELGMFINAA